MDGWLSQLIANTLNAPQQPAIALDAAAHELRVDGQRVALTRLECEVMQYLMERAGQAVKRGDLLDDVWGPRYEGGSNVIDVVILALRRKLGVRAPAIETVTRYGYRLRLP
ncbi:winged helix-turn-helix domain-containing protein [Azohydromonas caseinilytica]|uniref:Winged helix-turn-helix transcriptional regulator n=1 Tax=Azohydromonas caseinilytica TaxID=2728836 RepID=A0A848FHE1_9BURK|nr:winged helix-turn-helix domain-containing protein [Azohydromonas caseinilytica]NML17673.1 winged helix-turn-helix transcriptional regulator [Azohydromonas caseinilytica]